MTIVKDLKVNRYKNMHLVKTQLFNNQLLKRWNWLGQFWFIRELLPVEFERSWLAGLSRLLQKVTLKIRECFLRISLIVFNQFKLVQRFLLNSLRSVVPLKSLCWGLHYSSCTSTTYVDHLINCRFIYLLITLSCYMLIEVLIHLNELSMPN